MNNNKAAEDHEIPHDDAIFVPPQVQTHYEPEESLKNKIPAMAEEALKSRLRKFALKKCQPFMQAFADCSKDKLISVIWDCKESQNALNACLNTYGTEPNLNRLRHAYIRGELMKRKSYDEWKQELEVRMQEKQE